jgi:motility quorum-sensing regulator/GCU-specific mRNA interferase toxin
VVCSMSRSDFYKSMTTHASSQIWQDVYHPETPAGIAYIKVTLRHDGSIVIQFKEK